MAMGGTVLTKAQAKSASIEAVVTRCGCGVPASHAGRPCHRPKNVEPLGVVSYWHRNPFLRFAGNIGIRFREFFR